ncbi:M20 metallopeptidase family protein [Nocardia mangyaensis]|uniref:M20 metallopeptidase family protein n=1 Tax=Nocardia mangyaensis TaxID=2213200 RepID=UPI0026775CCB|nr:M20 family metallopeptidase [Nocardia mangyaensis]MDO3647806.1 M20 family metallopeptidase [Nocardia mangyaensis]
MSIREDAAALQGDLVQLRRALHREPELGLHLPRTQEKVLTALDGLGLEIGTGTTLSSVTAVLRGARPGPTVLLRGDMDALPVIERTGLDFAAQADRMHACGHDLHTAMLAGAAQLLSARADRLAGDVVFMFQPGEEGFDGAGKMLDEGVLDVTGSQPVAAYALHVISQHIPAGVFAARRGPFLSAADTVRVTVRGAGGHGSMPHQALDPIPAACEMVLALQTMVSRRIDIHDPVVITVGALHAGTQDNVIPDEAYFEATVRSYSPESHARVKDGFLRTVRGVAAAHGLSVEIDYAELYPVTVNDDRETEFAADTVAEICGPQRWAWQDRPGAGSEDFSRVIAEVPGAMIALGATPIGAEVDKAPMNHSPLAVFDESVLADGAAVYAELAIRRLALPTDQAEHTDRGAS